MDETTIRRDAGLSILSFIFVIVTSQVSAEAQAWTALDQGAAWTTAAREDFYTRDQGSRLMPLRWIYALRQATGEPFMADSLRRYGYLPNEASSRVGLPVGFTIALESGVETIGMTCAACHTRQIEVGGEAYRIDGGPALADIQSFLADLDIAVKTVLTDDTAFAEFAHSVLEGHTSQDQLAALRQEVQAWHTPYHTLMDGALPKPPEQHWGVGRLDAVGMIFDRLAGLDVGTSPNYIISENIKPADAPVRYPFLWNAPRQDRTQWPGFAPNGDNLLALARNLGEVYGVFGVFRPTKDPKSPLGFDYLGNNSANFPGLRALEDLLWKIGPPKWPWAVDQQRVVAGKAVYQRKAAEGGCVECHDVRAGCPRSGNQNTWLTPIQAVNTDEREYLLFNWEVKTGVLEGAQIPDKAGHFGPPLKSADSAIALLRTAVNGAVVQDQIRPALMAAGVESVRIGPQAQVLKDVYKLPSADSKPPKDQVCAEPPLMIAYESRVLQGIWATAPYLHNGSVPTLAELLKPAAARVPTFKIGPAYDPVNVGLATEQSNLSSTLQTTDCSNKRSGNSRCGHEYGTTLTEDEKKSLLEYLKTL